jgi:16S rRNA (uracil1498-N3)-methyltransferase
VKEEKEIKNPITLFYALSKGDKNEFVMQKATELGAKRIVLLSSKRSVLKMSSEDFLRKKERFEKIIKEASEQSKRTSIPEIVGVYPMDKIPQDLLCDKNFVAYEFDSGRTDKTLDQFMNINEEESVSILIGSEGGIDEKEIEALKKQGFITISLGKRILRTETASVYALSVLGFILERK